jgi:ParE toxin of type II toxin-antitoxin system, parDE
LGLFGGSGLHSGRGRNNPRPFFTRVVGLSATRFWDVRADELIPGLRSVLAHPHIVFYRVSGSNIEVVRVLHQRRDIDAIFGSDDDR